MPLPRAAVPVVAPGAVAAIAIGQLRREPNYDEARVGPYTLPDSLEAGDGARVRDVDTRRRVRRREILALVAPRPAYVASASEDRWADPLGERLGLRHAEPVYALYGLPGPGTDTQPPPARPGSHTTGYHLRPGGHDITGYGWEQFLRLADRHWPRGAGGE